MQDKQFYVISGKENQIRIDSRLLEEKIQDAVIHGHRYIEVEAFGQHGIGGRLWKAGNDTVHIKVSGHPGQRAGSMGFPNTFIEVMGPASDDVGWLNGGAKIVVHGHAGNGVANAMAQGKIYIAGNIGARAMTMTKANPRFDPPELWVLGSVGDYFGEFMAGGIAVICGVEAQTPDNVLGYRPFVGMVGGKVYFRGAHGGYSQADTKTVPIEDDEWKWLTGNLRIFLDRIKRPELFETLSNRNEWQLLAARSPMERFSHQRRSMASFKVEVWDKELGGGGMIGDLTSMDRSPIPLIVTGELRRFVPVWENRKFAAPCEASCPTGIPVQDRWRLIREGRVDEAVDLALSYTPFPATVCGYLCPNLCMQSCTRQSASMPPVDIAQLGKSSINAKLPELPPMSGKKIAVVGGGPSGISVAWQLRKKGHEPVIYDMSEALGGKIGSMIPENRIPREVVEKELERIRQALPHVHLRQRLEKDELERFQYDYDFVVIAAGAQKPRILPVPGKERMVTANDFLIKAKSGKAKVGKHVVIIGAGNVGCDVATEAHRLGAEDITLIDIQKPLSFGKERDEAEAVGAKFKWPCFTKEITQEGVVLNSGEILQADNVFISIGDVPDLEFLPETVAVKDGYIVVNEYYQTTNPKIFAIGDAVKPGLLTDAIGAGRKAAKAVCEIFEGKRPAGDTRRMIDKARISLEYFDPRITGFDNISQCGSQCSSCGACRDCGICETICPQAAISRKSLEPESGNLSVGIDYEYVVDENRCIGCGFCTGACPCGIWNLMENDPMI
jgi:NADPH-dependent glutamate synthase beta subunit-like oxidoreductase/glutamate synthase domain-containing protein 3/NAD-dependent dihydropyrimidine dehydrogenase PreA subunit